jgi:hypothetical protein
MLLGVPFPLQIITHLLLSSDGPRHFIAQPVCT